MIWNSCESPRSKELNGKVPLDTFATINARWEPAQIRRRDLNRVIEVRSQVEPGVRGNDVVKEVLASEEMRQLLDAVPAGYRVEAGGNLENSQDGVEQLSTALGISLIAIIMLLVIQYNGWAKPVIILTTLPLALIGALPGLFITGNAAGIHAAIGHTLAVWNRAQYGHHLHRVRRHPHQTTRRTSRTAPVRCAASRFNSSVAAWWRQASSDCSPSFSRQPRRSGVCCRWHWPEGHSGKAWPGA